MPDQNRPDQNRPEKYKVAVVQMNSGQSKSDNLKQAESLIEQAATGGAALIVLPEMFNCFGNFQQMLDEAEPVSGVTTKFIAGLAKKHRTMILAGSIAEQCLVKDDLDSTKAYNTSLLFGASGEIVAKYRKCHLFDVEIPDKVSVEESAYFQAGDLPVVTQTEFGRLGQAICYDLRFAELFRMMVAQDAEVMLIPAAFTQTTGKDHWMILLQARAIENQAYLLAANQCGQHSESLTSYGHSTIIDPWGKILAEAGTEPQVIQAEIDLGYLRTIRQQLPALKHRRF